jgi:hypothetical protein
VDRWRNEEQAQSYQITTQGPANQAATAADHAASGVGISVIIKGVAGVASLLPTPALSAYSWPASFLQYAILWRSSSVTLIVIPLSPP